MPFSHRKTILYQSKNPLICRNPQLIYNLTCTCGMAEASLLFHSMDLQVFNLLAQSNRISKLDSLGDLPQVNHNEPKITWTVLRNRLIRCRCASYSCLYSAKPSIFKIHYNRKIDSKPWQKHYLPCYRMKCFPLLDVCGDYKCI